MDLSGATFITAIGDDSYIGVDHGDHIHRSAITAMRHADGNFHVLYCGTWDNQRSEADSLAAEYHERCEAYDRLVCTGPIREGWIWPATSNEQRLININAMKIRAELKQRALMLGVSETEFTQAIKRHA
jgi:hypothetical protein